MVESNDRIKLLDSFRAISILGVLLYHFFSRFTPPTNPVSLYPYNDKYDFFGPGSLGVRFFFIISGFVIFFTLEKTGSFSAFWKKRFIRLFPSMLVASLVTFIVFRIFDNNTIFPQSHKLINFLPSLSFLNPKLINTVYHNPVAYIDGAYWSLWPEVQFYLFCSLIFYINRQNFLRNFVVLSIVFICFNQLMFGSTGAALLKKIAFPYTAIVNYRFVFFGLFNLIEFLPFFGSGVIFYLLYRNNKYGAATANYIKLCLTFFIAFILFKGGVAHSAQIAYFLMVLLFFCFIYYPRMLRFLDNKLMY
ncbi:MAG: acyltransferase, partial [Mucilaginibacter sp.]